MALINRKNKNTAAPKDNSNDWLKEYASINGINAYSFVQRNY